MSESWDRYFLRMAELASMRSSCLTRRVGAVAVKDKQILSTGYNGPPSKMPHCTECKRKGDRVSGANYNDCPAVHAEVNCLLQAAKFGIELKGATIYCTAMPCNGCFGALVNAGIVEVVTDDISCKPYGHDERNWQSYVRIRGPHDGQGE